MQMAINKPPLNASLKTAVKCPKFGCSVRIGIKASPKTAVATKNATVAVETPGFLVSCVRIET